MINAIDDQLALGLMKRCADSAATLKHANEAFRMARSMLDNAKQEYRAARKALLDELQPKEPDAQIPLPLGTAIAAPELGQ
jgi:hypothetical protein